MYYVETPAISSIIDVMKTTVWGESRFPARFLGVWSWWGLVMVHQSRRGHGLVWTFGPRGICGGICTELGPCPDVLSEQVVNGKWNTEGVISYNVCPHRYNGSMSRPWRHLEVSHHRSPRPREGLGVYSDIEPCPLLALFGEEDANPSPAHAARLRASLMRNWTDTARSTLYRDAGHAFLADHRPSCRAAPAQDIWHRVLVFNEQCLKD